MLNVCCLLLPRIARDVRTHGALERSDKECLEEEGEGGKEPDPFVETALS